MHVPVLQDVFSRTHCSTKSTFSSKDSCIQLSFFLNDLIRTKAEFQEGKSFNITRISSSTLSVKSNERNPCDDTASYVLDYKNDIFENKRRYSYLNGLYECRSKEHKHRNDVQLYYVFDKPFRHPKEPVAAQKSVTCTALCQVDDVKNIKDENKTLRRLVNLVTESVECKCVANKLRHLIPHTNELKPKCACAEAETQARRYGRRAQRVGNFFFNKDRGISVGTAEVREKKLFSRRNPGLSDPNKFNEKIVQTTQKCVNSSTHCHVNGITNEQESFKQIFRKLIEVNAVKKECRRLAHNDPKYPCTCVEAKTQSPSYGKPYQRAGREAFYREIGTSGITTHKINPELHEHPKDEVSYVNSEDLYYESDKPATVNRRIGCNGKYNPKCSDNQPREPTQKFCQSSAYCKLDDINNDTGVFTKFLQKFCESLIVPKNMTHSTPACCTSRGTLCNVDGTVDKDRFQRVFQVLLDPKGHKNKAKRVNPTGAEVMTQSRSYGGRQQRAGREIFCKNRGTSGAPKLNYHKAEEEEYEEVVEEFPTCLAAQPDSTTDKASGIGTNCKFNIGWYKDRHAYGEPKPQCDLKGAIEQWNEVPLRQTGTKTGASLKDSNINFYNTNAATQSRKYRGRHLRAGRETFYRETHTSCIPKSNKNRIEENYNAVNQPLQPPAPDRKAIRLGSDCSFCFEFFKDVPPESPDKTRPCSANMAGSHNKNQFCSKFIRQWLSSQANERQAGELSKSDACTCTDVCSEGKDEKTPERRPLHIGSKVSYNFNFSKSISPPKTTSLVAKEPCIKSSPREQIEKRYDAAISSEPVPDSYIESNNIDIQSTIQANDTKDKEIPDLIIDTKANKIKTAKKCLLELVSKNNFLRLIKGDQKSELEKQNLGQKSSYVFENDVRKATEIECPAKCKTMSEQTEIPDQPFRMASSFSFDYNMHNIKPKNKKITYVETFPRLEDFSGSKKKLNLFRLIMGKVRKRVKPVEYVPKSCAAAGCDPVECRKQIRRTWFSYILSNIKQKRQLSTSYETDAKSFFSDILSKTSKSSKSRSQKSSICCPRKCCNKRVSRGVRFYSNMISNLKEQLKETRVPEKVSTDSFIAQMLSKKRDRSRRRRRRRRSRSGGSSGSINPRLYTDDIDTLSSSMLPSPRVSRTSEEDCKPCRVSSDCCFKCDYNRLDSSENENSTTDSRNYATT